MSRYRQSKVAQIVPQTYDLPYTPHEYQGMFHKDPHRFRVLSCVPPGEIIPGEFMQIEKLKVGDRAIGRDGKSHKIRKVYKNHYHGNLVEIKARYCFPICLTLEHPVWVTRVERNDNFYAYQCGRRPKKTEWRVLDSGWVKAGDMIFLKSSKYTKFCVSIPRPKIESETDIFVWPIRKMKNKDRGIRFFNLDGSTGWIVGLYIAEGYVSGGVVNWTLGLHEKEYADRLCVYLRQSGFNPTVRKKPTALLIYVCHSGLAEVFKKQFGHLARNKKLPDGFLNMGSDSFLMEVLRGYSDGDGYCDRKRGKWSCKTASKVLALQIQLLIARFGGTASVGMTHRKPCEIRGRKLKGDIAYRVESTDKTVLSIVHCFTEKKSREYGFVRDKEVLCPVTSVSARFYSGDVFNLSTDSETYLVSNVLTHNCGRRWGKSKASIAETHQCLVEAAAIIPANKVPRAWVIAPTFALVEEDWRIALELFGPVLIDRNVAKMSMILPINNGRAGEIEFKSAERKDEGLRGAGIAFALLDEASRIPREAWELGIRPALADYRGRAVFISTPAGRNWFHDIWQEGQKPDSDWKSWKFPSNLNPYLPTEEWEAIKRTTPSLIFQQEYMAEFLEDSGMVFHGLDRCSGPGPQPAQEGNRYSIGVDLARTVDFTVITVLNEKGQVVHLNRSKELSWDHQKKLIHRIWSQYSVYSPCQVIMDSSGVGDPIEYDLRKMGVPTVGVKTQSSVLKSELIEGLMVAIEQGWITFPSEQLYPEHRWLWEEMRSFESEVLPSGHIRYQAPPGKHDDGVMSLCLAAHGFRGVLGKNKPENHIGEQKYTTYQEYNEMSNPKRPHVSYIGKFGVRVAPMVSPR